MARRRHLGLRRIPAWRRLSRGGSLGRVALIGLGLGWSVGWGLG